MIVGEQIRIQGSIEGAEDVVVRGRVEGSVRVSGTVTVEPGAWVIAEVMAHDVFVRGTVRGNIRAESAIEVARTGRMIGDATAPQVTIVAGAGFRGRVEMGDVEDAESSPPELGAQGRAASPAPDRPAVPPAPARGLPALARPAATFKRRAE